MTPIRFPACAALVLAMLAVACNQPPQSSGPSIAGKTDEATRDMARIDADVRLDVALKRIAVLEREVAALKAGPATMEADLLRQQLSATQSALANASSADMRDDDARARAPDRNAEPSSGPRANRTPAVRPIPQATARPAPDLDPR